MCVDKYVFKLYLYLRAYIVAYTVMHQSSLDEVNVNIT